MDLTMPPKEAFVLSLCLLLGTAKGDHGKVLIFGGNGLLGGAVTETLISAGYNVTLTNRGTWYWDTDKTIKPFVGHVYCDRYSDLSKSLGRTCPDLAEFVESVDKFDAVIDFSAYQPKVITQALELLENKAGLYIYISSDSIYEVCEKTHEEPTRETDANRPDDNNRREELAKADDYGNRKLMCEEELMKTNLKGGPAYVFLRLPDVIGPRDNTDRWWIYQLWVKLAAFMDRPVTYPPSLKHQRMGLVFSEDVGRAVVQILETDDPNLVYNKAYNLACDEQLTLPELLLAIGREIGVRDIRIQEDASDNKYYVPRFPSVKKGPVDATLAKTAFNFSPTPLNEVIEETADFFEFAMHDEKYSKLQKRVIGKLGEDIFINNLKLKEAVERLYPGRFNSDSNKFIRDEL